MSVDTLPLVVAHDPNRAPADDPVRPVPSGSVAGAVEHALRHAGYEVLPLRNGVGLVVSVMWAPETRGLSLTESAAFTEGHRSASSTRPAGAQPA